MNVFCQVASIILPIIIALTSPMWYGYMIIKIEEYILINYKKFNFEVYTNGQTYHPFSVRVKLFGIINFKLFRHVFCCLKTFDDSTFETVQKCKDELKKAVEHYYTLDLQRKSKGKIAEIVKITNS